ncbi:MAG: gas vesicle protein [Candidatus Schekmanbacteria bacterium]|nr:gas vesicle protein [Candidatus Schekmanbacteria bacterium]
MNDDIERIAVTVPVVAPEGASLCDALDRLLETGVVVSGSIAIKVADVELLYIGLQLVACSWDTARGKLGAAPPAKKRERDGSGT